MGAAVATGSAAAAAAAWRGAAVDFGRWSFSRTVAVWATDFSAATALTGLRWSAAGRFLAAGVGGLCFDVIVWE